MPKAKRKAKMIRAMKWDMVKFIFRQNWRGWLPGLWYLVFPPPTYIMCGTIYPFTELEPGASWAGDRVPEASATKVVDPPCSDLGILLNGGPDA